jgi:integral membrane sensor domain MASE1
MAKNWMLVALGGLTMALWIFSMITGVRVGRAIALLGPTALIAGAIVAVQAREWVWLALIVFLGPLATFVYGIYALLGPTDGSSAAAVDAGQAASARG